MKLSEIKNILPDAGYYDFPANNHNNTINDISYDSRQVKSGNLFVALHGSKTDGHSFITDAIQRGCSALLTRKKFELPSHIPQVIVSDTRKALAILSHHFFNQPSHQLKVIGITGTNGKTTTAYLLKSILETAGKKTGLLSTIKYELGPREISASITTPESYDIQKYLAEMVQGNSEYAIIEVTSHSLVQKRTHQTRFTAGVFTNLSRDHLDYHKNMKTYRKVKGRFFRNLDAGSQVILNKDDKVSAYYARLTPAKINWYSLEGNADFSARVKEISWQGIKLLLNTPNGPLNIKSSLTCRYNAANILAAASTAAVLGIPPEFIAKGIESIPGVPGRLEQVAPDQDYEVFVDFAHTDQALKNVLINLKKLMRQTSSPTTNTKDQNRKPNKTGRLILVFGCGGDRDCGKRPLMGEIAGRYANLIFITSDNPRTEDPLRIITAIEKGIKRKNGYHIQPDRYEAIKQALHAARTGDVVLIAGKGHEHYQILKDTVKPFDDRVVVREILGYKNGVNT